MRTEVKINKSELFKMAHELHKTSVNKGENNFGGILSWCYAIAKNNLYFYRIGERESTNLLIVKEL